MPFIFLKGMAHIVDAVLLFLSGGRQLGYLILELNNLLTHTNHLLFILTDHAPDFLITGIWLLVKLLLQHPVKLGYQRIVVPDLLLADAELPLVVFLK